MLLQRRIVAALPAVLVAIAYFALACAVYWPIPPLDAQHLVGDRAYGDAVQQAWFLQWTAFAIEHGQNPLFSTYLDAPAGANLAVNTSMPLLGLLGWPVTALGGSIAAFNLLLRLGLALSALSMFLVLRRYLRSFAAAFVGGLLFGFSPYMLGEAQLHVFLVFLPLLPPLIVLLDHWLISADRNPYVCGALIGLLLGLEMWISAELVAVFVILATIALIPVAIRFRGLIRSRLPRLVRGVGSGAVVGLVVGGYVAWMFLAGPERPHGPPHSVADLDSYHADLLSLLVPSRPQLLRLTLGYRTAQRFVRGNVHENGFYLGFPLLAVLVIGSIWLRRNVLVLSFATLGVVSFVLGLGTGLTIANHDTGIPLPFAVVTGLPALQEIGPTRFALGIQTAAAVLLAVVIDRALQLQLVGSWRRRAAATTAIALLVLVPLLPNRFVQGTRVQAEPYFASGAVAAIPQGAQVLTYPYPYYPDNSAMLWQSASNMRFRLPGGEIYVPAPDATRLSVNYPHGGLPASLWGALVKGGPTSAKHWRPPAQGGQTALVSTLRSYVAAHRIAAMVVSRRGAQGRWVDALAHSAFGAPTRVQGDLSVWITPA